VAKGSRCIPRCQWQAGGDNNLGELELEQAAEHAAC
jgi:hypothetical protein